MSKFSQISPDQLNDNVFSLIGKDWMLITAGTAKSHNTMTASWGGFGVLWQKNVCWCVVRPVRHTYQFINSADSFTLSFFDQSHRDVLSLCGSMSGRDRDKDKEANLTPVISAAGSIYYEEARLVIECRKVYFQDINPAAFLDKNIDDFYPEKDYHRMFIGEIIQVLKK